METVTILLVFIGLILLILIIKIAELKKQVKALEKELDATMTEKEIQNLIKSHILFQKEGVEGIQNREKNYRPHFQK